MLEKRVCLFFVAVKRETFHVLRVKAEEEAVTERKSMKMKKLFKSVRASIITIYTHWLSGWQAAAPAATCAAVAMTTAYIYTCGCLRHRRRREGPSVSDLCDCRQM